MTISKREDARIRLLKHLPPNAVGAEIGVWQGHFSMYILEVAKPKKLHLVDPWLHQPEVTNAAFGQERFKEKITDFYANICERYKDDERVEIHRMLSNEFFESIPDASLDWVYLDGNHNESYVREDLRLAFQKVKVGGAISGDDFHWKSDDNGTQPVKLVVNEYVQNMGDKVKFKLIGGQYLIRIKG